MHRGLLRAFFRLIFALLIRLQVEGADNVPNEGGVILAANHLSIFDAPLVFSFVRRNDLTGLVADKWLDNLFIRTLVQAVNGIWINREEADIHALRAAREYLRAGRAPGHRPGGTRSHTGGLIPAKTGVAYLADKADAPIVPVAIWGTEKISEQARRLHRQPVHICFGAPFRLPGFQRSERNIALEHNTDLIMCRIAAMMPASYRGVYAGHPCLSELLPEEQPRLARE